MVSLSGLLLLNIILKKFLSYKKSVLELSLFLVFDGHTNPLFTNLNFIKIHDIIKYHILKFVFEFLNNKLPPVLNNLFTMKSTIHNYPTRGTLNLYVPKTNTVKFGINSLRYKGPLNWNHLT